MFGLFRQENGPADGAVVIARLNARLQPLDRGDVYEDPLGETLARLKIGEVTGGGTMLAESGGVAFCEVEIVVPRADAETLGRIARALEALGAPRGSALIVGDTGEEIPFGVNEGLALHLNGTDLPDEVYRDCDINDVVEEIEKRLGEAGAYHSYWQGRNETSLYLYGPSAAEMQRRIAPFVANHPLCQKSRFETIA